MHLTNGARCGILTALYKLRYLAAYRGGTRNVATVLRPDVVTPLVTTRFCLLLTRFNCKPVTEFNFQSKKWCATRLFHAV